MDKELEMAILMQDNCTKQEAEKHLKNGTIVYEKPEDYIQMLKDNGCYNGETIEDIKKGMPDISMVMYEGHEYLIMYVL